jgi:MoxR-like ATPase
MSAEDAMGEDVPSASQCAQWYQKLRGELSKVIVGQDEVLEQVIVAVLARGHVLLEGLPGLAKSLLVGSLAEVAQLSFKRIQFTPDVAPDDITGVESLETDLETGNRYYHFSGGLLFANLILADELDQASPRTQSVMFDAMRDRQVAVRGKVHPLPDPFFVLATRNPLNDSDRRLREAQLDRFLLFVNMDYPSGAEEWEMARRVTAPSVGRIAPQLSAEALRRFQDAVGVVAIDDRVLGYAWTLVRATRPTAPEAPDFVDRWIVCGAGPRGLLALVSCAKARALIHGRERVSMDDVSTLVVPALRHRIVANPAAEANALNGERLIRMIMESVPPEGDYRPPPGVANSP